MADLNEFNRQVIEEFRANGGRVGGRFEGMDMLLLHTVGARSGQPRINPLAYRRDGDRLVIMESKAGAPTNPDWYHNVVARPDVEVEVGTERVAMRARVAEGDERDRLWEATKAAMPGFAEYETMTTRRIPVVVLEAV